MRKWPKPAVLTLVQHQPSAGRQTCDRPLGSSARHLAGWDGGMLTPA